MRQTIKCDNCIHTASRRLLRQQIALEVKSSLVEKSTKLASTTALKIFLELQELKNKHTDRTALSTNKKLKGF